MRGLTLGLLASAVLVIGGAPTAQAGVTCSYIPSMCPPSSSGGSGGGNSVPEPGTLGLLAVGATAAIARLRRKKQ